MVFLDLKRVYTVKQGKFSPPSLNVTRQTQEILFEVLYIIVVSHLLEAGNLWQWSK